MRGASAGRGAASGLRSGLKFAAYRGVRVHRPYTGRNGGDGRGTAIEDLAIYGGHGEDSGLRPVEHSTWTATTGCALGKRIVPPGPRAPTGNATFEYYYENVRTGTTGATPPPFHTAQRADPSAPWTQSTAYVVGNVVRAPNRFDVFFLCTQAGTSGLGPAWNYTPGAVTNDGTVQWTTYSAAGYLVPDAGTLASPIGPVWSCRVAAGVTAFGRVSLTRVSIADALNGGLHVEASASGPHNGLADGVSAYDLRIASCGAGIVLRGDADKATILGARISLYGPPTWSTNVSDRCVGVADRSTGAHALTSVSVVACGGPAIKSEATSGSTFMGTTILSGCGDAQIPESGVSYWGGRSEVAITSTSARSPYGATSATDFRGIRARGTTVGGTAVQASFFDPPLLYTFRRTLDADRYGLAYNQPATGWWGLRYGGATAIAYSAGNAAEGSGHAWAPSGILVGGTESRVSGAAAAPGGAGRAGDIVFNSDAAVLARSFWFYDGAGWVDGPDL